MKIIINLLAVLLFFCSCLNQNIPNLSPAPENPLGAGSVVLLKAGESSFGTAFYIGKGRFLTAAHVVTSKEAMLPLSINGHKTTLLKIDEDWDLALVYCNTIPGLQAFEFADNEPKVKDEVYASGWHNGSLFATSYGKVSQIIKGYVITSAPINKGCSGGPLINGDLKVIGVNRSILSWSGGWNGVSIHVGLKQIKVFLNDKTNN